MLITYCTEAIAEVRLTVGTVRRHHFTRELLTGFPFVIGRLWLDVCQPTCMMCFSHNSALHTTYLEYSTLKCPHDLWEIWAHFQVFFFMNSKVKAYNLKFDIWHLEY